MSPFLAWSLLYCLSSAYLIWNEPAVLTYWCHFLFSIAVTYYFISTCIACVKSSFIYRVIPYYSASTKADTFGIGKSLFVNLETLDQYARLHQCAALSSFIHSSTFLASSDRTEISWSDPSAILPTATRLIDCISKDSAALPGSREILNDLISIKNALEICIQRQISLTFVIRDEDGDGVSGYEMDLLKARFGGSYF